MSTNPYASGGRLAFVQAAKEKRRKSRERQMKARDAKLNRERELRSLQVEWLKVQIVGMVNDGELIDVGGKYIVADQLLAGATDD